MHSVQSIYDELRRTDAAINQQIAEVKRLAETGYGLPGDPPIDPNQIMDNNGSLMMTPLLVAKASCLSGIAALKSAELRNKK